MSVYCKLVLQFFFAVDHRSKYYILKVANVAAHVVQSALNCLTGML